MVLTVSRLIRDNMSSLQGGGGREAMRALVHVEVSTDSMPGTVLHTARPSGTHDFDRRRWTTRLTM